MIFWQQGNNKASVQRSIFHGARELKREATWGWHWCLYSTPRSQSLFKVSLQNDIFGPYLELYHGRHEKETSKVSGLGMGQLRQCSCRKLTVRHGLELWVLVDGAEWNTTEPPMGIVQSAIKIIRPTNPWHALA